LITFVNDQGIDRPEVSTTESIAQLTERTHYHVRGVRLPRLDLANVSKAPDICRQALVLGGHECDGLRVSGGKSPHEAKALFVSWRADRDTLLAFPGRTHSVHNQAGLSSAGRGSNHDATCRMIRRKQVPDRRI
jgi:hypothetical protein